MDDRTLLLSGFLDFVRSKGLVQPRQALVVAVSGGMDSMVLLDLLTRLQESWNLRLAVAHVNHQLRGEESLADEEFVRAAAERRNLPFYFERVDTITLAHTGRISKQEAAREARYRFFETVRQQTASDHVATAHQADDNTETILMNVLRGGGVRGLAGIPLYRAKGSVVRPLLFAQRKDILFHASAYGIPYRNDSSNESMHYTRNYVRKRIVPVMNREFGGDLTGALNHLADTMTRFSALLDRFVSQETVDSIRFTGTDCAVTISSLAREPRFLQEEAILRIMRQLGIEPHAAKIARILALCEGQTGRFLQLSNRFTVHKDRGTLFFTLHQPPADAPTPVTVGNEYTFQKSTITVGLPGPVPRTLPNDHRSEFIDAEHIRGPLFVRSWRKGDWFIPLGMRSKKKLSDFFGDEKVPRTEKSKIPILESNGNIVWVCGKRLDDRYKITSKTRTAIRLTYSTLP